MKKWTVEMKQSYNTIKFEFDNVEVAMAFTKVILAAASDVEVLIKEVKAEEENKEANE